MPGFHDKISATSLSLMSKLSINEGTIRFVTLVTKFFTIMNVKDKFSALRLRDECRAPWTIDCKIFDKLRTCAISSKAAVQMVGKRC